MRWSRFSKLSEHTGATQLLNQADLPSSTELLSRFAFWVAWVGFVLLGVSVLGIVGLQEYTARFFLFLPRLFAALVILFFGLLAASFFSRAALLAAVNANFRPSRLLSVSIRVFISIFTLSMAFEVLGIAERTIMIAFGTAFGAVMLGLGDRVRPGRSGSGAGISGGSAGEEKETIQGRRAVSFIDTNIGTERRHESRFL